VLYFLFQLSVVAIIMNITRTSMVSSLLRGLIENHNAHPSFGSLADLQVQFNHVAAVIVFFSWVKVGLRTRQTMHTMRRGNVSPSL